MKRDRTIAIVGATGAQGGGLVDAILNDPDGGFRARAITRDTGSGKAKALASRGAELVAADIDDEASIVAALDGAYGAFLVTFSWEHLSPAKEKSQVRNMAVAAKAAGLEHVIWSTLEDTRRWVPLSDDRMPTLMGEYKVPHFDAKGESNRRFTELGVPTTFLHTSFYWENLINLGVGPARGADGGLVFTLPMGDKKMPGIAAADIGGCAYGLFGRGVEFVGKSVGIAGEHLTGAEMAKALAKALGEEVVYNAIEPAVYRGLGFPGAEDLGNMYQFKRDFEEVYCAMRDVGFSRSLNPALLNFESWLAAHHGQIPIQQAP